MLVEPQNKEGMLTGYNGTDIYIRSQGAKLELTASPVVKSSVANLIASPVRVSVQGKTAISIVKKKLDM